MNDSVTKFERGLGWAVLLLLMLGCLLVLRPFVSALIWALVLCCSSWPLYCRLLRWVGQRRSLAAFIMTLGMILIMLLPFVVVGSTLADNVREVTAAVKGWFAQGPPAPPGWLHKVPVIGQQAVEFWRGTVEDSAKLWPYAQRLIEPISRGLLGFGLVLGGGLIELALSVFITFFLFRNADALAEQLTTVVERIAGQRGKHLLDVAGKTIRGVVYGILGTSLCQAVLAGIGFAVAGVPGPALLALLTFFASVIPVLGTTLVWLPAALWLFHQGANGWGIFMIIWGLGVGNVDNVIKPWLISQGSNMPFILIFFGVLGGALTFGLIGVFLGPTLLAVGYRLLQEWSATNRPGAVAPEPAVAAK